MLATRLASSNIRVLLVEAGEEDAGPFFKIPLTKALGFQATKHH